jgi:hypothetical protein
MSRQRAILRNMAKRSGETVPAQKRGKSVGPLQSQINKKAAEYAAGKEGEQK